MSVGIIGAVAGAATALYTADQANDRAEGAARDRRRAQAASEATARQYAELAYLEEHASITATANNAFTLYQHEINNINNERNAILEAYVVQEGEIRTFAVTALENFEYNVQILQDNADNLDAYIEAERSAYRQQAASIAAASRAASAAERTHSASVVAQETQKFEPLRAEAVQRGGAIQLIAAESEVAGGSVERAHQVVNYNLGTGRAVVHRNISLENSRLTASLSAINAQATSQRNAARTALNSAERQYDQASRDLVRQSEQLVINYQNNLEAAETALARADRERTNRLNENTSQYNFVTANYQNIGNELLTRTNLAEIALVNEMEASVNRTSVANADISAQLANSYVSPVSSGINGAIAGLQIGNAIGGG